MVLLRTDAVLIAGAQPPLGRRIACLRLFPEAPLRRSGVLFLVAPDKPFHQQLIQPRAQYNLGYCYACGIGMPEDMAQAAKWYLKAAEQGSTLAQYSLGVCYERGTGVPKDPVQAALWYREAANQGHALAQLNLGVCYENGTGVSKDWTSAAEWYRKAADQGNENAKTALRKMAKRSLFS